MVELWSKGHLQSTSRINIQSRETETSAIGQADFGHNRLYESISSTVYAAIGTVWRMQCLAR